MITLLPITALPFRAALAASLLTAASTLHAAWTVETVDATPETGQAVSLALNPANDAPAIAYNRWHGESFPNNFYAYAAVRSGSSWLLEELDGSLMNFSQATSIAFNSLGEPAVTYTFFSNNIRYRVRSGGSWSSALNVATNNGAPLSCRATPLSSPSSIRPAATSNTPT